MTNYMDEMQRHTRNLQTLNQANAPQSDIDQYMRLEGITDATIRQYQAVQRAFEKNKILPSPLARVGRGMTDLVTGVGQLTNSMPTAQGLLTLLPGGEPASNFSMRRAQTNQQAAARELADVQQYESAVGPGIDWWRLGGQAAATLPFAAPAAIPAGLGALARFGVGAAGAGAAGAALYAKTPQERAFNTGTSMIGGGVGGLVLEPLMRGGSAALAGAVRGATSAKQAATNAAQKIRDRIDNVDRVSILTEDLPDNLSNDVRERVRQIAADALENNQPFDADAALRQARAERFGFEGDAGLTRGQATRDPRIYSGERNLSKREGGEVLQNRFIAQNEQALRHTEGLYDGEMPPTEFDLADRISKSIQAADTARRDEISRLYKAIPGGGEFSPSALADRTLEVLSRRRTKIDGVVKEQIFSLIEGKRAFTFEELDDLLKLVSENMPPSDDAGVNLAAKELKEAIMGVFDDAATNAPKGQKEMYELARKAAKKRFEELGPSTGAVSKMAEDLLDPTQMRNAILGKLKDLKRLKAYMGADDWGNVQDFVSLFIREQALRSGDFSQAAYNTAVRNIGRDRLEIIFGKAKADDLIDFGVTARDLFRFPNLHTINTSNTAPLAENILLQVADVAADAVPGGRSITGLMRGRAQAAAEARQAQQALEATNAALNPQPTRYVAPQINYMDRRIPGTSFTPAQATQMLSPAAGLLNAEFNR